MEIRNLSSALRREPVFKFAVQDRVRTEHGPGQVVSRCLAHTSRLPMYAVRLDRPFELRNGTSIERSAFFELELDRLAA